MYAKGDRKSDNLPSQRDAPYLANNENSLRYFRHT